MLRVPLALREEGSGHEGGSVLVQSVGSLLDEREREAGSGNLIVFSPPPPFCFCASGFTRYNLSAQSMGKCIKLFFSIHEAVKAFVARVRTREHQ